MVVPRTKQEIAYETASFLLVVSFDCSPEGSSLKGGDP